MIVVNINKSYPEVLAGDLSLEDATRGNWKKIAEPAIAEYGDVIIGVFRDRVVSAYDIVGHHRLQDDRVQFDVRESEEFASLIGQPSPVGPWKSGQARPIVYVDSHTIRFGDAPLVQQGEATRAVVHGYILTVSADGTAATVIPPAYGRVTVTAPLTSREHPLTYVNLDGDRFPAAIIDRYPMGGYIFIEYIQDGAPVIEAVEDGRVGNEEDLQDAGYIG